MLFLAVQQTPVPKEISLGLHQDSQDRIVHDNQSHLQVNLVLRVMNAYNLQNLNSGGSISKLWSGKLGYGWGKQRVQHQFGTRIFSTCFEALCIFCLQSGTEVQLADATVRLLFISLHRHRQVSLNDSDAFNCSLCLPSKFTEALTISL